MKSRHQILLLAVAVLALTARSAPVQPEALAPAGVLVLANAADPDSLAIARHYAAVRGVPSANLISWPMPTTETVNWREFADKVWNPLLARLVADRWIDAIPMATFDAVEIGRAHV